MASGCKTSKSVSLRPPEKKSKRTEDSILTFIIVVLKQVTIFASIYLIGYMGWSIAWVIAPILLAVARETRRRPKKQQTESMECCCTHMEEELPVAPYSPDVDRCEWLNLIIKQLWPSTAHYIRELVQNQVQPKLRTSFQEYHIRGFGFDNVAIGNLPPRIVGIKVYEKNVRNEIIMDMELFYCTNCDIQFHMSGYRGEIEDFHLHCFARVVLKPLISFLPLIGGLQICLLRYPEIDFTMNGIVEAADLKFFGDLMRKLICEQIAAVMVLPNKFSVSLTDQIPTIAVKLTEPEGVIRIHIIGAKRLTGKGACDPYAVVYIGAEKFQTPVKRRTLDPKWDYWCDAKVYAEMGQTVVFEVWCKDSGKSDDFLGRVTVDMRSFVRAGPVEKNLQLEDVESGVLHVSMQWFKLTRNPDDIKGALQEVIRIKQPQLSTAVVTIFIDYAENLKQISRYTLPDPYVQCSLNNQVQETSKIQQSTCPFWEEGFTFLVEDPYQATLFVKVKDRETEQDLGNCEINLSTILSCENCQTELQSYALQNSSGDAKLAMALSLKVLANYGTPDSKYFECRDYSDDKIASKHGNKRQARTRTPCGTPTRVTSALSSGVCSAIPSAGIPSTAIPSAAIPSTGMTSTAIPSLAIPSAPVFSEKDAAKPSEKSPTMPLDQCLASPSPKPTSTSPPTASSTIPSGVPSDPPSETASARPQATPLGMPTTSSDNKSSLAYPKGTTLPSNDTQVEVFSSVSEIETIGGPTIGSFRPRKPDITELVGIVTLQHCGKFKANIDDGHLSSHSFLETIGRPELNALKPSQPDCYKSGANSPRCKNPLISTLDNHDVFKHPLYRRCQAASFKDLINVRTLSSTSNVLNTGLPQMAPLKHEEESKQTLPTDTESMKLISRRKAANEKTPPTETIGSTEIGISQPATEKLDLKCKFDLASVAASSLPDESDDSLLVARSYSSMNLAEAEIEEQPQMKFLKQYDINPLSEFSINSGADIASLGQPQINTLKQYVPWPTDAKSLSSGADITSVGEPGIKILKQHDQIDISEGSLSSGADIQSLGIPQIKTLKQYDLPNVKSLSSRAEIESTGEAVIITLKQHLPVKYELDVGSTTSAAVMNSPVPQIRLLKQHALAPAPEIPTPPKPPQLPPLPTVESIASTDKMETTGGAVIGALKPHKKPAYLIMADSEIDVESLSSRKGFDNTGEPRIGILKQYDPIDVDIKSLSSLSSVESTGRPGIFLLKQHEVLNTVGSVSSASITETYGQPCIKTLKQYATALDTKSLSSGADIASTGQPEIKLLKQSVQLSAAASLSSISNIGLTGEPQIGTLKQYQNIEYAELNELSSTASIPSTGRPEIKLLKQTIEMPAISSFSSNVDLDAIEKPQIITLRQHEELSGIHSMGSGSIFDTGEPGIGTLKQEVSMLAGTSLSSGTDIGEIDDPKIILARQHKSLDMEELSSISSGSEVRSTGEPQIMILKQHVTAPMPVIESATEKSLQMPTRSSVQSPQEHRQRRVPPGDRPGVSAKSRIPKPNEPARIELTCRYSAYDEKLFVVIHKAKNLPMTDPHHLPDFFVNLQLLPDRKKDGERQTHVIKENCNPVFEAKFEYKIPPDDFQRSELEVSVSSPTETAGLKVIGTISDCELNVEKFPVAKELLHEFPMTNDKILSYTKLSHHALIEPSTTERNAIEPRIPERQFPNFKNILPPVPPASITDDEIILLSSTDDLSPSVEHKRLLLKHTHPISSRDFAASATPATSLSAVNAIEQLKILPPHLIKQEKVEEAVILDSTSDIGEHEGVGILKIEEPFTGPSAIATSADLLLLSSDDTLDDENKNRIFSDHRFPKENAPTRVELSIQYYGAEKKLLVTVHKAENLPLENLKHLPDPFVKLYLLPNRSKESKRISKIVKDTCNPVFEDASFEYDLNEQDLAKYELDLNVLSQKDIGLTGLYNLGSLQLPLNVPEVRRGIKHRWYNMTPKHSSHIGTSAIKKKIMRKKT